MLKYRYYWNHKALLLIGLITVLSQIQTALSEPFPNDIYDYVDVAKATNSSKSKGKTTRIFTSEDDLDETFWLKYLGEEFRNAVHMKVDSNNNVIPVEKKPPRRTSSNLSAPIDNKGKRTRFVRKSSQDKKHIPVEPKRETFYDKATSKPSKNNKNHKHFYTNNKALNNKNKIFIQNKNKQKIIKVKPSSAIKALHEPILVNLPENDVVEHQIHKAQIPFVVKMPPVIYHQQANMYPRQKSNLEINNRPRFSQTRTNKNLPHTLQHEHSTTYQNSYHTLDLPSLTQSQFQPDSYMIPPAR